MDLKKISESKKLTHQHVFTYTSHGGQQGQRKIENRKPLTEAEIKKEINKIASKYKVDKSTVQYHMNRIN